jgi:quercetin dioxygenase-like cupin family protein
VERTFRSCSREQARGYKRSVEIVGQAPRSPSLPQRQPERLPYKRLWYNTGRKIIMPRKQTATSRKSFGTQAARPADLVEYQSDAIVSREIIRKKTGSVTLFAFDAGQGLSEHTAPFDALVQVLDGEAEITIAGKRRRVSSGELIRMPANQPHALKASQRFKMMLIMIRS